MMGHKMRNDGSTQGIKRLFDKKWLTGLFDHVFPAGSWEMPLERELPAKLGEMIHFISPQHLQVRHILNVMASGPILPKVGKVNILWLFLLQFEILPATFAGALRRQCGFQSFLGKVQKSFSREYSYKGKPYHDPKVRFCSLNIAFLVKNGIFTNR